MINNTTPTTTTATTPTAAAATANTNHNTLLDLEHMPLLDYISYADLQAVRDTADANLFGVAGLDEFGTARVPIAFAIESAVLNYEHNFNDRVQIAVEMARRYGPTRTFVDPSCGREDTVLRRAFRQVIVYPSPLRAPSRLSARRLSSSSIAYASGDYEEEEEEKEDQDATMVMATTPPTTLLEQEEEAEDAPNTPPLPPHAAAAAEGERQSPDDDENYTSDIPLVLKLVTALIREAGASAMEPNVVESAVHHGLHELLPLLFQEGALFQPRGMLCLHLLLRDTSLCDARIAATLKRLLQYKAVETRRLSMQSVQRRNHNTPLHAAARSSRGGRVMRLLLRMGANPFLANVDGHTALDLVRQAIADCVIMLRPERVTMMMSPPAQSGCTCSVCTLRAERRNTHRLLRALSAQKVLERAEMLREAELACMMATHSRLGESSLLRWVDPFMLRDLIVRPACAL